jgi:glutathione S-transferase
MRVTSSEAAVQRLLTFPPMIDSEACRFLLSHYGVPYREEAHLFGWASLLALWHGWTVQIPLLYGNQSRLAGPWAIAAQFDPRCKAGCELIPAEKPLSDEVAADWERLNGTFGTAVAVFAYYQLLPHREIMTEPFSRNMPAKEKSFLRNGYPALAFLFTLLLRLNADHAKEALGTIRATADDIDDMLKDGRPYLMGDRFTLADIALASSAAPVLLPEGYTGPLPPLEQMPVEMAALIREVREHQMSQFVSRIYRDHGPFRRATLQ